MPSLEKLETNDLNCSKYANVFTLKFGRPIYITPASYLVLLDGFRNLMAEQQQHIQSSIDRYRNGLARLAEASKHVNRMQAELSLLQPKLVEASQETDAMMKTIQQESAEVEKTSTMIRADEVAANQEAAVSQALKAECEADLAQALPALEGQKRIRHRIHHRIHHNDVLIDWIFVFIFVIQLRWLPWTH